MASAPKLIEPPRTLFGGFAEAVLQGLRRATSGPRRRGPTRGNGARSSPAAPARAPVNLPSAARTAAARSCSLQPARLIAPRRGGGRQPHRGRAGGATQARGRQEASERRDLSVRGGCLRAARRGGGGGRRSPKACRRRRGARPRLFRVLFFRRRLVHGRGRRAAWARGAAADTLKFFFRRRRRRLRPRRLAPLGEAPRRSGGVFPRGGEGRQVAAQAP